MERKPSALVPHSLAVTLSGSFSSLTFIVRGASVKRRDATVNNVGPEQRSRASPAAMCTFNSITCVSADARETLARRA